MSDWIDPDDAPILTAEIAARAEIRQGGKVIRPATGTLTRMGRPPLGDAASSTNFTATISTAAMTAVAPGPSTAMPSAVAWTFTTNAVALSGQAPIDLGNAGNFAIFTNTAVTSVFPSNVQGNIGTAGGAAGTTITCPEVTPVGTSFIFTAAAGYADATCNTIDGPGVGIAAGHMAAAITDAKARVVPDFVDAPGVLGDISGLVLAPGLYKYNTGVLISGVGITLAGGPDDIWIFQISGDLTVQNNAIITLGPLVKAKNIFWQTGGVTGAIIGSNVQFKGIVLADAGITLTAGSVVIGRLYANPAITLITNTITPPAP